MQICKQLTTLRQRTGQAAACPCPSRGPLVRGLLYPCLGVRQSTGEQMTIPAISVQTARKHSYDVAGVRTCPKHVSIANFRVKTLPLPSKRHHGRSRSARYPSTIMYLSTMLREIAITLTVILTLRNGFNALQKAKCIYAVGRTAKLLEFDECA